MKLKNKLLPLVGVSAVCATVAPIALTSCGSGGLVNLTDLYKTQVEALQQDTMYTSEAAETYFTSSAANPEIFKDDFYWSQSQINNVLNHSGYSTKGAFVGTEIEALKASYDSEEVLDVTTSSHKYTGMSNRTITKDNEKISNVKVQERGESGYTFWTVSFDREIEWTMSIDFEGSVTRRNAVVQNTINTSELKELAAISAEKIQDAKVKAYDYYYGDQESVPLTTEDVISVSGKVSYKNVPIALAYDNDYSLWYTLLDKDVDSYSQYKWEYLWGSETGASITTKINVLEDGTETREGLEDTFHNEFVYDLEMDDEDSMEYITILTGLDNAHGSGYFATLIQDLCEFGYSHYLFNIDYKY